MKSCESWKYELEILLVSLILIFIQILNACRRVHVFPRLPPVVFFPRLPPVGYMFPALSSGYMPLFRFLIGFLYRPVIGPYYFGFSFTSVNERYLNLSRNHFPVTHLIIESNAKWFFFVSDWEEERCRETAERRLESKVPGHSGTGEIVLQNS